ncbi:MAG: type II secretion system protein [Verrucomicrobiota bacterium]|nr:type II secretion system protein [Verrucomicrobiota bacterium]
MKKQTSKSGFTLLEIMLVTTILAIIMAIAVPNFLRARRKSQMVLMAKELQTYGDAYVLYSADNGAFPDDTGAATHPAGTDMDARINSAHWAAVNKLGGYYKYDGPDLVGYAGISLFGINYDYEHLLVIDQTLDDGDLASGRFRLSADTDRYTLYLSN